MQEISSDLAGSLASYLKDAARFLDIFPRFATLLAGTVAAANISWGQDSKDRTVFYASVGGELTLYDMDVDAASLTRQGSVTLPANIQYAWPHPSKQYFYVVS